MVSFSEKEGFEERGKPTFISHSPEEARENANRLLDQLRPQGHGADNRNSDRKAGLSDDSALIRKEKVKEAKRKKEKGDYDSREVYKKIADRLMDLFGI